MALVAICSGALCALPVVAQDATQAPQAGARAGRMGGERQLEFLTKKLNLTSDQQTQIKAINDDSRKQMMALRDDSSLSQDDRRSKMMDLHKSSQDKIRGVLTDDQKTKYDELQSQMRERMKNRRHGGDASGATPQS